MIHRIDLRPATDEVWYLYLLRLFLLFRGKPHIRYAQNLLFVGVALLTITWVDLGMAVLDFFENQPIPGDQSNKFNPNSIPLSKMAALGCFVMSPVIFLVGELIYLRNDKRTDLPLGDPSCSPDKSLSALKFTASGVINFIGRDAELAQLEHFMNSADAVSWCAISGMGASGKSRLALELCNIYKKKRWRSGFYDYHFSKSLLSTWNPKHAHLIVIDYAGKDIEIPLELIKHAVHLKNSEQLLYPIRIVLLDREAQSTIEAICKTFTFGESIKRCLYSPSIFNLAPVTEESLGPIVFDICDFFEVPDQLRGELLRHILNCDSDRKILVAGLRALEIYLEKIQDPGASMEQLINQLITQEREKHWEPAGFDSNKEQYLIAATMADGIYLSDDNSNGTEVKAFLDDFDFPSIYGKIVGEAADYRLTPLSHDVISELYVLISFDPSKDADRENFHKLVQICLQINHGQGLVNFFTRAANDWPRHPSLNMLLPRFGQSFDTVNVWLALMGNIIDKIEIPLADKINLFSRTFSGAYRDSPEFTLSMMHVFEGLSLRILREASGTGLLDLWLRDYSIVVVDKSYLPAGDQKPSPIDTSLVAIAQDVKVRPKDYCDAVIESFECLDVGSKKCFIWPGLLEVYHHAVLHRLADRAIDLRKLREFLGAMISNVEVGWGLNRIFKDVIVGLIQFGHTSKNKEDVLDIVEYMVETGGSRNSPDGMAELLSAASAAYGHISVPYDKKRDLHNVWESSFKNEIYTDEKIATQYVGFAVGFMHGFNDPDDLKSALELMEKIEGVAARFPNNIIIENLNLCFGQLTRQEQGFLSNEEADVFLEKAVILAKTYAEQVPKVPSTVIREISTRYSNAAQKSDPHANKYFHMGIELCRYLVTKDLGSEKLYLGQLLENLFQYSLRSPDYDAMRELGNVVGELQQNESIDISHFFPNTSILLSKYQGALNVGDGIMAQEIAQVALYWLEHLHDTTPIRGLFEHIVEDNSKR